MEISLLMQRFKLYGGLHQDKYVTIKENTTSQKQMLDAGFSSDVNEAENRGVDQCQ